MSNLSIEIQNLLNELSRIIDENDVQGYPRACELHRALHFQLENLSKMSPTEDRSILLLTKDILQVLQRYQTYLKAELALSSPAEFSQDQLTNVIVPPSSRLKTVKYDFVPPAVKQSIWLSLTKGEKIHIWKHPDVPAGWAFAQRESSNISGIIPMAFLE